MMKGKVVAALIGLSLGMSGGVVLSYNEADFPIAQAQFTDEYDSDSEPDGDLIVNEENYFGKPMTVEKLKTELLKNYQNIFKRSILVIKNQTSLSGHLSDVLKALFDKKIDEVDKQIQLYLIDDGLDTKDFNELIQLLQDYKIHPDIYLDQNQIANFSFANRVSGGWIPNIYAYKQRTDPAVNRQLPTLSVNDQQQVLIPLNTIWKFGAPQSGLSITSLSNANFPLSQIILSDNGTYSDFRVYDSSTGRYTLEALDYLKPNLAYLPNQYHVEAAINKYENNGHNEAVIEKLKGKGFTVNSYLAYLNDITQSKVIIKHVTPDAKKLELRLMAMANSGVGFDATLEFPLSSAASSSSSESSATPPNANSSSNSKVSIPEGNQQKPSITSSATDNPSGSSSLEMKEASQINKNPSIAKKGQAVYALNKIHLY